MLHLISSEEKKYIEISPESVKSCEFFRDILCTGRSETRQIPFENIKICILKLLVEFLEHYRDEPMNAIRKVKKVKFMTNHFNLLLLMLKPLSGPLSSIIQPWYFTFVTTNEDKLIDLLKASDFINYKPLYELICATIASKNRDEPFEKNYIRIL